MRQFLAAAALAALFALPAGADSMKNCAAAWDAKSSSEKAGTTYRAFSSMCLKADYKVPAAGTDATAPAGATAKCKDGTYSMSTHHSGTCSHHGGVANWLK